jgi:hypothetical protein
MVEHIDDISDPDLRLLYSYWLSKRGSRRMPRRAEIDPVDIPTLLPFVFLVDVRQGPLRFRFRLIGTAICARWGSDATWKYLDQLDLDGEREVVLRQYAAVVETGKPRFDVEEFITDDGRYVHYERVLLPLSEDDTTPNILLGGQHGIGVEGYQIHRHRWL